ncbi:MAG TPA: S9 family peptidase [Gemmatimonadales bacterium]|nr:S9 family peptidase [Gemmatimonadales bacterium]
MALEPPRRASAPAIEAPASAVASPSIDAGVATPHEFDRIAPPPPNAPAPPRAAVRDRVDTRHGDLRVDEYHWLRDREDPAVIAYLEAENEYTRLAMRHTEALQERLYQELVGRIQETDLSVPERLDEWLYYSRVEAGQQYPLFCRKRGSEDAPEEVLLDLNRVAEGHPYCRLGASEVSPDHRYLAYSLDLTGAEQFTLFIKNIETGELGPERIVNTARGVAWANDNRTLFYTVLDDARRPAALWRHRLGSDPALDVLMYHEPDEAFFVDVSRSRSREWLFLEIESHTTSEVRALRADQPEGAFRPVEPRAHGVEYNVAHRGDRFYIVTNDGAENFRLVTAPVSDPGRHNWRELLPHRTDVKLDGVDLFRRYLVAYERRQGLRRIRVIDLEAGGEHEVDFPESAYALNPSGNPEFDTTVLRFVYTSLVTPSMVVDYDMATRTRVVRKQTVVRGGYDATLYRTERVSARAAAGAEVPISLVYRRPLALDGSRPLLLLAYGAYGVSFDPAFSSNFLSLLDRGIVVAIAHVRGGEELGRRWYEDGKLLSKRNTFTDFVAAAEHLIAEGYTSSERLAINGGSAGGLLMGAVTNLRPDLFRAVVAEVPFVDVINTMLDPSLPLTVIEYEEWGNPSDPAYYAYMRSYSPYDNVRAGGYPHMLVTGGLNDPRVAYWEPAKWTARLRARKTNDTKLLLKTNMGAGHAGASGRYNFLREVAFKYAFLLDALGLDLA